MNEIQTRIYCDKSLYENINNVKWWFDNSDSSFDKSSSLLFEITSVLCSSYFIILLNRLCSISVTWMASFL